MSHPITEEKLLAAGYRKYRVPIGEEPADIFYHKNLTTISPAGQELVKCAIGVYHYNLAKYLPSNPDGYKVEARFEKNNGDCFTVDNSGDCAIEEHEAFFERVWKLPPDTTWLEVD